MWLPQRVYISRSGAYEYHPPKGGSKTIAPKGARKSEVLRAYEQLFETEGTVRHLYERYRDSERYTRLAIGTKKQYEFAWKKLEPVFGDVQASTLTTPDIRYYMDLRGKTSRKGANVELIFLRLILDWGIQYSHLSFNPCDKVTPYILPGRTRYVTDQEYKDFYSSAPETVQIFMEIAYICAARGQDVRALKLVGNVDKEVCGIVDGGLYIKQGKTGKAQIKLWNNRLKSIVDRAKALREERLNKRGLSSPYLIVTPSGGPYTAPALTSLWNRAKRNFEAKTETKVDWTFHDLKAKGISDFEGDKKNFSGHKNQAMVERYNRTPDKTKVIDF
jgi:hypothetical protein